MIGDCASNAMVTYGLSLINPAKKKPPIEVVGAELEKAMVGHTGVPALLGPITERLVTSVG